ncbi:uncharacterized protein LOC132601255 [Lycium barbarum]|uniref:uncharacterized protein LOC132601255 n=1 Tax=Lycium barbarum TaxID=112863 RepID=UPI00293EFB21|nr:uncharacterized protein LOC132601255 [Lycium barbarum]
MAGQPSPQPLAVGETSSKPTYASFISPQAVTQSLTKTQLKPIEFNNGEATITFTMEEIAQYTVEEGLHQALVLKFSYGQPDMNELRKLLPKILGVKGKCLVRWLARRHVLIRFDRYEEFVLAATRFVNYLHCNGEEFLFRVFPWSIGFNPKEETSRAFTWISLPNLPPELFAKKSLLSIASAVGKPIAIAKATQEKMRPSTARVKVELDLLDKHPNHIRVQ